MKFSHGVLLMLTSLQVACADANNTDRYALPPGKVYIEPCHREALLLHPGVIEKQRMMHRNGDFWLRYEILANDSSEWLMLCDLANGRMLREQKLVDDAYE